MRKTFALQVWQTAGLILGTPRSRTTSNLHADAFTPDRDAIVADDVLFPRQRQLEPGHPLHTTSVSKSPSCTGPGEYANLLHKEGKARLLEQKAATDCHSDAPVGRATCIDRPVRRQQMQGKNPTQTVKCVNFYTNASFLYVRATL